MNNACKRFWYIALVRGDFWGIMEISNHERCRGCGVFTWENGYACGDGWCQDWEQGENN